METDELLSRLKGNGPQMNVHEGVFMYMFALPALIARCIR